MTIYALSSGPGISGIAVIRISGKETLKILKLLTKGSLPKPRVATIKKIIDPKNSELIDEGIILWFPGPDSYTGEDMAELHTHGSKAVIDAIQEQIDKANSKVANVQQIKKFTILEEEWTDTSGELTPTLKLKRNVINETYKDKIEAMYEE